MTRPNLTLVPTPTRAEEARALSAQARVVGRLCVDDFLSALAVAETCAREVAGLGDAVPAGVRDRAERMAGALKDEANGVVVLMGRSK